nr:immunoglobulin light chain junction region [Macaca mulatta]
WQQCNSLPYSF